MSGIHEAALQLQRDSSRSSGHSWMVMGYEGRDKITVRLQGGGSDADYWPQLVGSQLVADEIIFALLQVQTPRYGCAFVFRER
eukprot:SAG31_NODE_3134_length_4638_cov_2.457810_3_plen_83_part_00